MIQMMQGHALTILSEMPQGALFGAIITDPPHASGATTQSGISVKHQRNIPAAKAVPIQTLKRTQWTSGAGQT